MTILRYLDYPIPDISDPVAEILFILTDKPSNLLRDGVWQYFLSLESPQIQRKGTWNPVLILGWILKSEYPLVFSNLKVLVCYTCSVLAQLYYQWKGFNGLTFYCSRLYILAAYCIYLIMEKAIWIKIITQYILNTSKYVKITNYHYY